MQTLFGPPPESKPGLLDRFKKAMKSTRETLVTRVENLVQGKKEIDASVLEELEEILLGADVGMTTTQEVLDAVRLRVSRGQMSNSEDLKEVIKAELQRILESTENREISTANPPVVILVVGVNGTGKTTTIGKLAHLLSSQNKKVLLCAGDTFRAAAAEQLGIWGERTGCEVIHQKPGADPSAVLFDALTAAKSRNYDYVIADTAGRLHTKVNLMAELEKLRRTSDRVIPGSPHEVLLVMDATTGQNGLQQARLFTERSGVTGIVLTKLDGTAKGGVVLAIARELKLPIRYAGIGEQKDDLVAFDANRFIESLFS